MKTTRLFLAVVLILIPVLTKAQCVACLNNETTDVSIHSLNRSTIRHERNISILSDKGYEYATLTIPIGKGEKLTSFSGKIVDENGKEIRKIKKSELINTEYTHSMAEDGSTYYYEPVFHHYPVTIVYSYTLENSCGTPALPKFIPQTGTHLEVKSASYRLTMPAAVGECNFYPHNMERNAVKVSETADGGKVYEGTLSGLSPLNDEPMAPAFLERVPYVEFVPERFAFDGYEGKLTSWNDLAEWTSNLLNGRDELPDELRREIHSMTDNLKTQKEKIAVLYNFLGKHTRYVSIQLGIGGFRPAPASEVYRTGYGDCKALTNFMRSMLKEAGIESYYTIISTRRRKMNDYPSFGFFDHVILKAIIDNRTVWVECTAPELPLGFIPYTTSGHDALVICGHEGIVETLPKTGADENMIVKKSKIEIDADGKTKMSSSISLKGFWFDEGFALTKISKNRQEREIMDFLSAQGMKLCEYSFNICDVPFSTPSVTVKADFESTLFFKGTRRRRFIPLTPFIGKRKLEEQNGERKSSVEIRNGMTDIDSIYINLPDDYEIESCPSDTELSGKFGTCTLKTVKNGRELFITIARTYKEGTFAPDDYKELYEFQQSVNRLVSSTIVLKKEDD